MEHDPTLTAWRCGCRRCRDRRTAARRLWEQVTDNGRWPVRTPAALAAVHAEHWHALGYSDRVLAAVVGVDAATILAIRHHRWVTTDRRHVQDLERLTHRTLLTAADPAAWVPVVGAERRVQALARIGWTATSLPLPTRLVQVLLRGERDWLPAAAHRGITGVYERLQCTPGPPRRGRLGTTERALTAGWPPPLAWDEDLDDPDATPHVPGVLTGMERVALAKTAWIDNVEWLYAHGLSPEEVCGRLGTSLNAAAIRLRRADRLDLYGPFAAAQTRDRADRDATTVRGDDIA